MFNEGCLGMAKAPKITILKSLWISALDLLDFLSAAGNSLEIESSI